MEELCLNDKTEYPMFAHGRRSPVILADSERQASARKQAVE
jgi:hypothetical protein